MASFSQDIEDRFQRHTSFANNDLSTENIRYFEGKMPLEIIHRFNQGVFQCLF